MLKQKTLTTLLLTVGMNSDNFNSDYTYYLTQKGSNQEVIYYPTLKMLDENSPEVRIYDNRATWTKVIRTSLETREHPRHQLSDSIAVNYDLNLVRFGVNIEDVVEVYNIEEVVMYTLDLDNVNVLESEEKYTEHTISYEFLKSINPSHFIDEQILWHNLAQREIFLYGEILESRSSEEVDVQIMIETSLNFSGQYQSLEGHVTFEYPSQYPVIFTSEKDSIENKVDLSWLDESCKDIAKQAIISQAEQIDMEIYVRTKLNNPSDYLTELDHKSYTIPVFIGPSMGSVRKYCNTKQKLVKGD
ncbi:hypothetical protein HN385_02220 [archaeon]|jgi:hypothetical protein|nr:hypothetical protein [archaeon]MBT3450370.1 hypothetical protein [archaeon]MBT6868855.1 hypothetical protein [archaeon]MBT7192924.1 hypothetical protein [archaeon]MBT7380890.1 hypothetical protein [archaeon]